LTTSRAASSIWPRWYANALGDAPIACAGAGSTCSPQRWRKRLIKLDIVNAVLAKLEGAGVSRVKAEQAVETVFESLKNGMGRSQRIELRRFGVFTVKPRKTGIGRNPRTGEEVNIPPGKAVRFKPGKELQGLGGL
jgi:DNA-binding protein HU-beta